MHRTELLESLQQHLSMDAAEEKMVQDTIRFVNGNQDCFERTNLSGHITGSAWILDESHRFTLMMHHAKLGMWLQPGGHSDGDPYTAGVALREAQEETGLTKLKLATGDLFDVDVHPIPARKTEPAHFHYDMRYLIVGDRNEPLQINSESKALKWILLEEVAQFNDSRSVLRMVERTLKNRTEP